MIGGYDIEHLMMLLIPGKEKDKTNPKMRITMNIIKLWYHGTVLQQCIPNGKKLEQF